MKHSILIKVQALAETATSLSTYDFSTLNAILPHNLIKEKLLDLIEHALKNFKTEGNDMKTFLNFHRPTD